MNELFIAVLWAEDYVAAVRVYGNKAECDAFLDGAGTMGGEYGGGGSTYRWPEDKDDEWMGSEKIVEIDEAVAKAVEARRNKE